MIDVSEILNDPELGAEFDLVCVRNDQTVGTNGRAVNAPTEIPFAGVVTNVDGDTRTNTETGSYATGSILIHTQLALRTADDNLGHDADIVKRGDGRQYLVVDVSNYIRYGVGFVAATCEPRRSNV
jgi:uncharacterized protein YfaT (DUF1175 family)